MCYTSLCILFLREENDMKKRIVCLLMAALLAASAAGCDKKNNAQETTTAGQEETVAQTGYDIVDYKEYVVLGDYKSVQVEADRTQLEITDEEVQNQIDAAVSAYATENQITEGVVKAGDTINLDFSGLLDGVAFANGTATDVVYTVGGSYDTYGQYTKYIDDLDNGLVGLEVGREYEIPCKFPEDYGNEELNGKDVIFVVTVNHIVEYIEPEFNDELVKRIAQDDGKDIATTEDMIKDIKRYLSETKKISFEADKYAAAMQEIIAITEFKGMPESEYSYLRNNVRANIQNEYDMYGSYYGAADVESFYAVNFAPYYGYETLDEFTAGYAENFLKEKMVVTLIAEQENITVSEDEIREYGEEMAANNGLESYDAIIAQYGEVIEEEFRFTLLQEKVFDFLVENIGEK